MNESETTPYRKRCKRGFSGLIQRFWQVKSDATDSHLSAWHPWLGEKRRHLSEARDQQQDAAVTSRINLAAAVPVLPGAT